MLTHAHLDHIGIVNKLQKKYSIPVFMHQDDEELANTLSEYCKYFNIDNLKSPKITTYVDDADLFQLNDYKIKVIHTPGHTLGGVCYLLDNNLFSGDTIFNGSIGRTDLPGGNHDVLIDSIKNKIFLLDEKVTIHSGHGDSTTIKKEKKENVFLNNV